MRCRSPRAIYTWPGTICCPSRGSHTDIAHNPSMRCVNAPLKAAGMCCAMTTAGPSAGKLCSTARMASVPPVDAPIAMMRSVVRNVRCEASAGNTASAEYFGITCTAVVVSMRARTRACAAPRTLVHISSEKSRSVPATSTFGLDTKSTAPSSSARSVVCAPRSVSEDTMMTGIGRRRIRLDRKVSPSMRGISTSSVSTSGFSALIRSRAISGSLAAPTTSISAHSLSISVSIWRTSEESSTISTRTFLLILCSDAPIDRAADQLVAFADPVHALGVAQEQNGSRRLQLRHAFEQRALGFHVEINHHIAAENSVKRSAHRPLVHQIELLEGDQLTQRRRHLDRALLLTGSLLEKLRCPGLRHALQPFGGIPAGRAGRQYIRVQIGGENPGIDTGQLRPLLAQHHGYAVGLLTGRTGARPDAQPAGGAGTRRNLRQHVLGEIIEMMRLAKERGQIGGNCVSEFLQLERFRAFEKLHVVREARQSQRAQATRESPIDHLPLGLR